jgi:hypothetical protein
MAVFPTDLIDELIEERRSVAAPHVPFGSMGSAATWQDALLEAVKENGLEPLATLSTDAMRSRLPRLRDDEDLLDVAHSSTAANVALLVEMIAGRVPISDSEPPRQAAIFARELAHRNVPVSELSNAYRVAQRALWRWGVEQIMQRIDDEECRRAAIEGLADASFATGDFLINAAMERYAIERERWVRSADAVRRATVEEILGGGSIDIDTASGRLRYELRRSHVAFVVWAEPAVAMLESAAAAVGGPGVLLVPMGTGIVAGWCGASSLDPGKADEPVNVAIGTRGDGIDGFRRSHSEALEARRVARLAGMRGRVRYEDVALPALLTSDIEQARAFAARELQDLAADGETERRLSETVLAVLEAQGSPRRAGQRLGIHENTVAKRLRAAENLLGRGIDERPSELLAALIVRQIVNA